MRRTVLALVLAVSAAACAPTAYDRYRAAHPEWVASLVPPPGATLDEVVATLFNPALGVGAIEAVDLAGERWRPIDPEDLESGRAAARHPNALVVSRSWCVVTPDDVVRYGAVHWHLIVDGVLAAAEQTLFDARCFSQVERAGAELPEDYAECLRHFAEAQIRDPLASAKGCGAPPVGS